jgi:hypothetical protein
MSLLLLWESDFLLCFKMRTGIEIWENQNYFEDFAFNAYLFWLDYFMHHWSNISLKAISKFVHKK